MLAMLRIVSYQNVGMHFFIVGYARAGMIYASTHTYTHKLSLARAQGGETALICAAHYGRTDCVRLLLDAGACMEAKDQVRSGSVRHMRMQSFHFSCALDVCMRLVKICSIELFGWWQH